MSFELLLQARGVGKTYSGTAHPIATLKHALFGWRQPIGDEYPVLHSVDLDIRRGETVGIMGRNGAGKTTLLGILGNVIQPSEGIVERHGKIATLLGLTAGFNPNFSGRENAYLFCSIQGLSRQQTNKRIVSIETFAELGRYFDMPLHTYSSGMQARLAFSCAIHVDADLIIIDETLAVGDANFRIKCYDRIRHMKQTGQTFLLVSHNPNMVANFCTRGILLEKGTKVFDGPTFEAVEAYKQLRTEALLDTSPNGSLQIRGRPRVSSGEIATLKNLMLLDSMVDKEEAGIINAELEVRQDLENITLNFSIRNSTGIVVCAYDGATGGFNIPRMKPGEIRPVQFIFLKRFLPGRYFVTFGILEMIGDVTRPISILQNVLSFDVCGNLPMTGIANLEMRINLAE